MNASNAVQMETRYVLGDEQKLSRSTSVRSRRSVTYQGNSPLGKQISRTPPLRKGSLKESTVTRQTSIFLPSSTTQSEQVQSAPSSRKQSLMDSYHRKASIAFSDSPVEVLKQNHKKSMYRRPAFKDLTQRFEQVSLEKRASPSRKRTLSGKTSLKAPTQPSTPANSPVPAAKNAAQVVPPSATKNDDAKSPSRKPSLHGISQWHGPVCYGHSPMTLSKQMQMLKDAACELAHIGTNANNIANGALQMVRAVKESASDSLSCISVPRTKIASA